MTIGIVTVYNSYNYGSLLQAVALYDQVSKLGNVVFLDAKQRKMLMPLLFRLRKCLKDNRSCLSKAVSALFFELREYSVIKLSWKKMPHCHIKEFNTTVDICILGSDEIWNTNKTKNRNGLFFGEEIVAPCIAYAPTLNTTLFDDIPNKFKNQMINIRHISVRDKKSKNEIQGFIGREIPVVLDPTFFESNVTKMPNKPEFDYIACYLFEGRLSDDEKREIIQFARRKGLLLVSIGQSTNWCDMNMRTYGNNPFLHYFRAKYVITNTFHGTAYAINYKKQFVTYSKNNTKIHELLEQFGLTNQNVNCPQEIQKKIEEPIDYRIVNKKLKVMMDNSISFIERSIEEIKNEI